MTRSLSKLTIIALATMTLGGAAAYAQTPAPAKCGIETWSADKMMYVTVPCTGEDQNGQTASAPGATKCGPEAWSSEKMMYVGTPCPAGLTYENPAGPKQ